MRNTGSRYCEHEIRWLRSQTSDQVIDQLSQPWEDSSRSGRGDHLMSGLDACQIRDAQAPPSYPNVDRNDLCSVTPKPEQRC